MSEKTKKFDEQLSDLISRGDLLQQAIRFECDSDKFGEATVKELGEKRAVEFLEKLPDFRSEYQSWYSEALVLIKQVLPDRYNDFSSYYEYPRVRKGITVTNYMIRDYLQGFEVARGSTVIVNASTAIPAFVQQLHIVKAAKETLDSALINLTSILQADLFDSEIDSARELAKLGFLRAAGAMCGVVIEKHLNQVCAKHSITIKKKKPTISDFNQKLKDESIISIPQWRFIQHLSDIRNNCDHARDKEPEGIEVDDLVSGTDKVLKTVF